MRENWIVTLSGPVARQAKRMLKHLVSGRMMAAAAAILVTLSYGALTHSALAGPPQLNALTITPDEVDVSTGPASVDFTLVITADSPGVLVAFSSLTLVSPTGQTTLASPLTLSSGILTNGTFTATFIIPPFSEPGLWRVNDLRLSDLAGNRTQLLTADIEPLPTELEVTGTLDPEIRDLVIFGEDKAEVEQKSSVFGGNSLG